MANFCIGENFSEELTCAVCLDSWKDPVELQDCQHVLCRDCVKNMVECPICRAPIQSIETAHRTLVNMAQQVQVKCGRCAWCGTREQSMSHVCDPKKVDEVARQQQQYYNYNYADNSSNSGSGGTQTYNNNNNHHHATSPPMPAASSPPPPPPRQSLPTPFNAYGTAGQPAAPLPPPPPQPQRRSHAVIDASGPAPWLAYNMTQVEYDQIVSLFVYFDSDESGRLDRREVARLARWLNFAQTDEDIARIFNDMDVNHNGSLTLSEFLTWLCHNRPSPEALYGLTQSQYNTIMMQFHTYDVDRNGYLGVEEFTRLVMNIGDVRDIGKGRKLFQMIDRNQTGRVSLHDFLRFRSGRM